ncbi:hypothetical protein [Nocardia brasiliensis]|nr:hypothetical protein [Nocardia brasiliensis]
MEREIEQLSTDVAALQTLPERDHGAGAVIWPDPTRGSACRGDQ